MLQPEVRERNLGCIGEEEGLLERERRCEYYNSNSNRTSHNSKILFTGNSVVVESVFHSSSSKNVIVHIIYAAVTFVSAFVIFGVISSFYDRSSSSSSSTSSSAISSSSKLTTDDDYNYETCSCPTVVTLPDCMNTDYPVLGGIDFVSFFESGISSDKNESGLPGLQEFNATYGKYKYTFLFASKENLDLFNSNPSKYVPQYGGFCSWGMSSEYCPSFSWSANCLGPSGNWQIWEIINGKLYFFFLQDAKQSFVAESTKYIKMGDKRWDHWYKTDSDSDSDSGLDSSELGVFNTKCYKESAQGYAHASGAQAKFANEDAVLPKPDDGGV